MFTNCYYLKMLFRTAGMAFLIVIITGCSHPIAFHELEYILPVKKKSENIIVVIEKSTLERVVSIRSFKAGLIHRWDAQPGKMLKQVADIEFPQMYNKYIFSNSIIEPPWEDNTFLLQMKVPEYQFKNGHTYYSVGISVFDERSKLLDKKYQEEGVNQGGKMSWAGAFGMKSAIRQSSLDALKKIFKRIRRDISNLLETKQLNARDEDLNTDYLPLDDVVPYDAGDYEYYSPQNSTDTGAEKD